MPRADGVYNGGAGRNQVGTAEFAKECEVADGRVRQWVANDGDLPHTMRKGRNYFGDTSRAWGWLVSSACWTRIRSSSVRLRFG